MRLMMTKWQRLERSNAAQIVWLWLQIIVISVILLALELRVGRWGMYGSNIIQVSDGLRLWRYYSRIFWERENVSVDFLQEDRAGIQTDSLFSKFPTNSSTSHKMTLKYTQNDVHRIHTSFQTISAPSLADGKSGEFSWTTEVAGDLF